MRRIALSIGIALVASILAASESEEIYEKAFSMEGVSRVSVENFNGRVEATTWDRPYLKVQATKKATGGRAAGTRGRGAGTGGRAAGTGGRAAGLARESAAVDLAGGRLNRDDGWCVPRMRSMRPQTGCPKGLTAHPPHVIPLETYVEPESDDRGRPAARRRCFTSRVR